MLKMKRLSDKKFAVCSDEGTVMEVFDKSDVHVKFHRMKIDATAVWDISKSIKTSAKVINGTTKMPGRTKGKGRKGRVDRLVLTSDRSAAKAATVGNSIGVFAQQDGDRVVLRMPRDSGTNDAWYISSLHIDDGKLTSSVFTGVSDVRFETNNEDDACKAFQDDNGF